MTVALAAGGAGWESAAAQEIEAAPGLVLARRCVDVAELLATAEARVAQVALVSIGLAGLDADTVDRLGRGGVRVVAIEASDGSAAHLGIQATVRLGSIGQVARTTDPLTPPPADGRATLVAVCGSGGAPGRSTVALGLASAAAARGVDTILVDADPAGGSLGQALAVLDDVSGLVAACRAANAGRHDEILDHALVVDPGLRLVTGIPRPDMWAQVRTGALDLVISAWCAAADVVVVDCGHHVESTASAGGWGRTSPTAHLIERAQTVVVVGRPDPVGLARLVRTLHEAAPRHDGSEPVLVVNMMRPTLGWDEREVAATLHRLAGTSPTAFLPFDQAALDAAVMAGRPARQAAPASPFVARIEALARLVIPTASSRAAAR